MTSGSFFTFMYTPDPADASSLSHLDDDFYTDVEYLMEATVSPGLATSTLSPIELAILEDIGFEKRVYFLNGFER